MTPTAEASVPKQDPFQLTIYQLALHEAGQLTSDELRITLNETVPAMKAALDAQTETTAAPPAPGY